MLNLYMDLQAEKIELAKMLLDTDDESLIQKIRALFKVSKKDFWEELPEHVKQGIQKSRKQASEGQLIPFDQITDELENL
jgi:hypothetical protein